MHIVEVEAQKTETFFSGRNQEMRVQILVFSPVMLGFSGNFLTYDSKIYLHVKDGREQSHCEDG